MPSPSPQAMLTLRHIDAKLGQVPAGVVSQIGLIDAAQGKEELFSRQAPAILERLVQVARIQSAESSNAIEGVFAPSIRIRELMAERTEPRNRSEAEIAGYRSVLDLVQSSAPHMPLTSSVILQMHRDLYRFVAVPGGRWKTVENHIEETTDGERTLVFRTLPALQTPAAMDELHELTRTELAAGRHHRLLVVGAYVVDFLCVHPFLDGNGRMSRLLTLLLLSQADYRVGRYVSLEKAIEDSKETYYEALRASSFGWHAADHDPWPWLEDFLGILVSVYGQLVEHVETFGARGAKTDAIERFVAALPAGATSASRRFARSRAGRATATSRRCWRGSATRAPSSRVEAAAAHTGSRSQGRVTARGRTRFCQAAARSGCATGSTPESDRPAPSAPACRPPPAAAPVFRLGARGSSGRHRPTVHSPTSASGSSSRREGVARPRGRVSS